MSTNGRPCHAFDMDSELFADTLPSDLFPAVMTRLSQDEGFVCDVIHRTLVSLQGLLCACLTGENSATQIQSCLHFACPIVAPQGKHSEAQCRAILSDCGQLLFQQHRPAFEEFHKLCRFLDVLLCARKWRLRVPPEAELSAEISSIRTSVKDLAHRAMVKD